jgi:glycosyltransferase involved in cell wall biosynthesis
MRDGRLRREFEAIGVPVHVLSKARGLDFGAWRRLGRLIRSERYDLIHSHSFSPSFWIRLARALGGGPPVVVTEHTIASGRRPHLRWLDRLLLPQTERLIAVSEAVRDSFYALERTPPAKLEVIYNGVDEESLRVEDPSAERAGVALEFGLDPADILLVTVGRFEEPKGHDVLLQAAPAILAAHPRSRFLLVGDGSLRAPLAQLAERLGLGERVVFTGFRGDARRFLAIADLCVVPSRREGLSLAVLEAMALARPIVATRVGGNPDAIEDGRSGVLVPPSDAGALSDAIGALLSDAERRAALGAGAAARFLERYTARGMVARIEDLYDRILGLPDGGAR